MVNNDHRSYVKNMNLMQQHLLDINARPFDDEMAKFIAIHRTLVLPVSRPPPPVLIPTQQMPFTDWLATELVGSLVDSSDSVELFPSSDDAFDAISSMEVSRHDIQLQIDALLRFANTCMGDFITPLGVGVPLNTTD